MTAGLWQRDTVAWMIVATVLPAAVVALADAGLDAVWRIGLTLAVILVWQGIFLLTRAQPLSPIAVLTAVSVTVLAPGQVEPWQLVLAVSFGTVIGEQIFGGWGRNVINAGVATLAFLYFAFPETPHEGAGGLMALAVVPALVMLVATGIASWQVIVSTLAGLVVATLLIGADPMVLASQGSLAFGIVFLIADPVASAATRGGRWVYGLLAGGLIALFGWGDAGIDAPHAVVYAALLASLFAPLIDSAVLAVKTQLRRPRNG